MPRTGERPAAKWDLDNTLQGPWTFIAKERVICLCEGGHLNCWREDPAKQKGSNALVGLHSNWVGDQGMILAMSRPWQDLVVKYSLVDVFIRNNIGMILNLQEVGEHENCGPGILRSSGFSYDPDTFMAGGVGFYNFSWRDMGVPDLLKMMDIVQVMEYVTAVEKRKIAVHCHAGLGRTGLAIACYFVYVGTYDAATAISVTRRFRPGALQTETQVRFVSVFEQYLAYLRCIFRPITVANTSISQLAATKPALPPALPQQAALSAAASPLAAATEVKESNGVVTEVFASGLTIVRASTKAYSGQAQGHGSAVAEITAAVGGGAVQEQALPWNPQYYILPVEYDPTWQPQPASSYAEALERQQQLIHGPTRRAYLNLHWFVKEAAFAVIEAAKAHRQSGGGSFARVVCDSLAAGKQDHGTSLAKLKNMANAKSCEPILNTPLPVVLRAMEEFFAAFDPSIPSISPEGLRHMSKVYKDLPFSMTQGFPEPVQVASAAQLLAPLPAQDNELLVLLSAMGRHIAKASAPRSEAELVQICRWLVQLLLSKLASKPVAEEALMSFLWCLLRNDAAYAAAIQCKRKRFGKRHVADSIQLPPAAAAPMLPGAIGSPGSVPAPQQHSAPAPLTTSSGQLRAQPPQPHEARRSPQQRTPTPAGGPSASQQPQARASPPQPQQPQQAQQQPPSQQAGQLQAQQQPTQQVEAQEQRQAPLVASPPSNRAALPRIPSRARQNQVAPEPTAPGPAGEAPAALSPGPAPLPPLLPPPRMSGPGGGGLPRLPPVSGRAPKLSPLSPTITQDGRAPLPPTGTSADGRPTGAEAGAGVITKAQLQNVPPTVPVTSGPTPEGPVHDVWA